MEAEGVVPLVLQGVMVGPRAAMVGLHRHLQEVGMEGEGGVLLVRRGPRGLLVGGTLGDTAGLMTGTRGEAGGRWLGAVGVTGIRGTRLTAGRVVSGACRGGLRGGLMGGTRLTAGRVMMLDELWWRVPGACERVRSRRGIRGTRRAGGEGSHLQGHVVSCRGGGRITCFGPGRGGITCFGPGRGGRVGVFQSKMSIPASLLPFTHQTNRKGPQWYR